jgi:hypothetical protein
VLQTLSTVHPNNVLVPFGSNIDPASGVLFFTEGNGTHGLFEFKKSFLALKGDTDHWTSCRGEYVLPAVRVSSLVCGHADGGLIRRADLLQWHGSVLHACVHLPELAGIAGHASRVP